MVEPLRKRTFITSSVNLATGMYVVEESNAKDLNVPHLPLIGKTEIQEGLRKSKIVAGDIVYFNCKTGQVRTILTKLSNENTLLVTQQCENKCLFCSQPPNEKSDIELYNNAALALINFNFNGVVGISGGEPTKNRNAFITLLRQISIFKLNTRLHVLTHGRNLSENNYVEEIAEHIEPAQITWGIPVYGHRSSIHELLVNSEYAFSQTLQGIANLSQIGHAVEARVIPVVQNYRYLTHIVNFIANNFQNIETISIMNMEPIGWAKERYCDLYVDVSKQDKHLLEAVSIGVKYGIPIKLFNYPLCLLSKELRKYAVKSISDWKNYFPSECYSCEKKEKCVGFFTSATGKYREKVEPLL